jgi:hypothetical protein
VPGRGEVIEHDGAPGRVAHAFAHDAVEDPHLALSEYRKEIYPR